MTQSNLKIDRSVAIDLFSPITSKNEDLTVSDKPFSFKSEISYGIDDISTWLGGKFSQL